MSPLWEIEEEVEALDERAGHGGARHHLRQVVALRAQYLEGGEEHPAVAALELVARRSLADLHEGGDGGGGLLRRLVRGPPPHLGHQQPAAGLRQRRALGELFPGRLGLGVGEDLCAVGRFKHW